MSKIVGDAACPSCVERGRDKTGNHLILFEDGGAYCNRCGYTDNWKENDIPVRESKEITDEELTELLSDFNDCKFSAYPDRGLSEATTKRFGCRAGVHPTDKTKIGSYLLPTYTKKAPGKYELTGYKVGIPKDQRKEGLPKYFNRGRVKDACLFGEQLLPNQPFKKLFITEAPMDAMALYEAIKDSNKGGKWAELEPNVVALPHGTGSVVAALSAAEDKIKLADEVILVFDSDEAGAEAIAAAKTLVPRVKAVHLPLKDCNEMLLAGRGKEMAKACMWGAEQVRLDTVVDISEIVDDIVKRPVWGYKHPWETLNKLTYGWRTKEIIGVAGGVGIGKSDTKYEMAVKDVKDNGVKVGVFDLEATGGKTGKAIVGKVLHMLLHNPELEYDEAAVRKEAESLAGKIKLYRHNGSRIWDEGVKDAIRHMVVVDGCKRIFLDNMTSLVSHLSSSEANDALNTIMGEIASMVEELDFNLTYFAHLNPPKSGPTHERGGAVHESQLTGSRAMIKWSHYLIGLQRNKDPELPEYERNTTTVVLLKDREFGNVGKFKLFYNKEDGSLKEIL